MFDDFMTAASSWESGPSTPAPQQGGVDVPGNAGLYDVADRWEQGAGPYATKDERQAKALGAAVQDVKTEQENRSGVHKFINWARTKVIPFVSSQQAGHEEALFAASMKEIESGSASDEAYKRVAEHLVEQERVKGESTGRAILDALGHAPAIVGEAALTGPVGRLVPGAKYLGRLAGVAAGRVGLTPKLAALAERAVAGGASQAAVTPLMPSLWYEQSQQRATKNGGSWTDAANLAPALAYGMLQNATLGQISGAAKVGGRLAGAGLGGLAMPAETAAADVVTGFVDDKFLNDRWKIGTNYGTIGDLVNGRTDDAIKKAAVQATIGAAFGAWHGNHDVTDRFKDALDSLSGEGKSAGEAGRTINQDVNPVIDALKKNDMDGAEAKVAAILNGKVRKYAEALLPKKPATEEKVDPVIDPEAAKRQAMIDALPDGPMKEALQRQTGQPEAPPTPAADTPQAKLEALTLKRNSLDFAVNKAQADIAASAGDPEARSAANKALYDAKKARKSLQKELDAARDEVNLTPQDTPEAIKRDLPAPEPGPEKTPAGGPIVEPAKAGEAAPAERRVADLGAPVEGERRQIGLRMAEDRAEGLDLKRTDLTPDEKHAVGKYGDGQVFRVPLTDAQGNQVGRMLIVEEPNAIVIPWGEKTGLAGGEGRGVNQPFGPRELATVARRLAEVYPDKEFVKYVPAEGRIRVGEQRIIPLARFRAKPQDKVAGAEPAAEAGKKVEPVASPVESTPEPVQRNLMGEVMPKTFTSKKGTQATIEDAFREADRTVEPTEMGKPEELPAAGEGMFNKAAIADDGGVQAAKDNAKFDADNRIIHRIPGEEGMEAFVAARPDGKFYASLRDREAGKSLSSGKVFDTEAAAVEFARNAAGEKPTPPDKMSGEMAQEQADLKADIAEQQKLAKDKSLPIKEREEANRKVGRLTGHLRDREAEEAAFRKEQGIPKDPLSPLERSVFDAAERDMSYSDIAQLPETRKANKRPYTKQRIEQIHRQALAKLGESKESLRKAQEAEKIDNALRMIERGQNVRPGDLGPPEVATKRIDRRIRAKDNADRTIEDITNQFMKESEDAGPQGLSPERVAEFDAKVRAALEGATGTPAEAKSPARPVPAKVVEPQRTQRNPNSLKNLKQNGRPKGIIHELRKEGGLDPEAFQKFAGKDTFNEIMEEVKEKRIPNPFLTADGRSKGTRHIEDVLSERLRTGDATAEEYQGVMGPNAEAFIEKIKGNKPSADMNSDTARIQEAENEFYRKLEEEKRDAHKASVEEGTDFDFGGNAVDEATRMLWDKMSGEKPLGTAREADFEPTAEELAALKPEARSLVQRIVDGFRKLGGAMVPATSRISEKAGNTIARYISARSAGVMEAPHVIDLVMKPEEQPYGWVAGPVLIETRLRHMREAYIAEAERLYEKAKAERGVEGDRMRQDADDLMTLAENVTTMVGKPMTKDGDLFSNPIANEEFYHQWAQSPDVIKTLARLSEHLGPRLNEMYRESEGFEPGEDLPYFTQLPGLEFHLQRWEPGDPGEGVVTRADTSDTSSKLRNILARKNPFARLAKGNAEGYVTDLPTNIAYSLQKGRENAAKSTMYRQLVKDGMALPSKDGVRPADDYVHELRGALPAAGMRRLSEAGQTSLWFRDVEVRKEVDQAINYEAKWRRLPLTGAVNWLTLASLGEVTAHTKNLMTMMLRPGMRFRDLAWNARAVLRGDPIIRQQLVDLATIGALKPEGFEAHDFAKLSRLNFMKYTGKLLDFVDRTMRLTADNAFARLSRIEGVQKTEQNRRDFINQLGQYNKRAQNHLVKMVREMGIGPFATAGTTWNVNALRTLFGGHGIKTDNLAADMKLRAAMLGRMAIAAAIVPLFNYLKNGNVSGDENTPLGAVKLGTDSKGKTEYFDLMALTGLTRGLRMTGLLSLAEAQRPGAKAQGAKTRDAIDSGAHMAVSSLLHPFEGPAINFLHTAVTGENTFGQQIAATPTAATTAKGLAKAEAAGKPGPDNSQMQYNLIAAMLYANPIAGEIVRQFGGDPANKPAGAIKELMRQMGPYGVKTSSGPPGRPHRMMKVPVKTAEQHQLEKK